MNKPLTALCDQCGKKKAAALRRTEQPVEELQNEINNRMAHLKYNLIKFGCADL